MKRKVAIVACAMWAMCALGGGAWERLQRYMRHQAIPPGQIEVENLKNMYEARLFDEVLKECDQADSDSRYVAYKPQVLYVRWITDRQLGRVKAADKVQKDFLERFPDDILAADMHFSTAIDLLALADYKGTEAELRVIHSRYPRSSLVAKADYILAHLEARSPTLRRH